MKTARDVTSGTCHPNTWGNAARRGPTSRPGTAWSMRTRPCCWPRCGASGRSSPFNAITIQPVAPALPAIPLQPFTPAIPLRPVAPTLPFRPLLPAIPLPPAFPLQPFQPALPVQPFAPLRPFAPFGPDRARSRPAARG